MTDRESEIAELEADIARLQDARPVTPEARAKRDECLAAYQRHLARLRVGEETA